MPQLKRKPTGQVEIFSLLPYLGEILIALAAEIVFWVGIFWLARYLRRSIGARTAAVVLADVVGALFVGFVLTIMLPQRITPALPIPGLSLVVVPLVLGALSRWIGGFWERQGWDRPLIWTFWAGGLFGFVVAALRFYAFYS